MASKDTRFSSEYQPKTRGKSEKTKILEAMKRQARTQEEFYDLLVERAFNPDDNIAFTEVMKRISPIPKAVAPSIEFELKKDSSPHEKASQILDAISDGNIPPDIGVTLITSIKAFVDIEEFTELKRRIEKLEAALNANFAK